MAEKCEKLLTECRAISLIALIEAAGIDREQQQAVVGRVFAELVTLGKVELGERVLAEDVLDDDQVVTIVALLVQELVAAVGHLRPVTVRISHYTEIVELRAAAVLRSEDRSSTPSEPRVLVANHLNVGV